MVLQLEMLAFFSDFVVVSVYSTLLDVKRNLINIATLYEYKF